MHNAWLVLNAMIIMQATIYNRSKATIATDTEKIQYNKTPHLYLMQ